MKSKISVTVSPEVLAGINELANEHQSRSQIVERILKGYLRRSERLRKHAADVAALNEVADELNAEMAEVLEDQALWLENEDQIAPRRTVPRSQPVSRSQTSARVRRR